jgi:hypothetical protein
LLAWPDPAVVNQKVVDEQWYGARLNSVGVIVGVAHPDVAITSVALAELLASVLGLPDGRRKT